jgi:hypothetical protein
VAGGVEIKFECQMYKVRDDEYMIDIQVSRLRLTSTVVTAITESCFSASSGKSRRVIVATQVLFPEVS